MGHRFADISFTPGVQSLQEAAGSRAHYAEPEGGPDHHEVLGEKESSFIGARDSFYMASIGETGWPYVQHRGGQKGFLKVLDDRTLAFADFRGNRQYISLGNLNHDSRVALILVDYPSRMRLKLLGHVSVLEKGDPVLQTLKSPNYRGLVERGFLIRVAAFDWNCPQHIVPRYTSEEIEVAIQPLKDRIRDLEAQLRTLSSEKPAAR
jgi:predicted pyridoxine 5'-phosphate oxidase superfamily flavin-nucleotide-binding protein